MLSQKNTSSTNNRSGNDPNSSQPGGNVGEAHQQAEKDIKKDPDFSPKPDAADDLDEGELAQFEGEE